jgi:hypothetical protein
MRLRSVRAYKPIAAIRELIADVRRKLVPVAPKVASDFVLGFSPSRFDHRIEEATPPRAAAPGARACLREWKRSGHCHGDLL